MAKRVADPYLLTTFKFLEVGNFIAFRYLATCKVIFKCYFNFNLVHLALLSTLMLTSKQSQPICSSYCLPTLQTWPWSFVFDIGLTNKVALGKKCQHHVSPNGSFHSP